MNQTSLTLWLTVREVADRLRVSRMTVYRLIESGGITAYRIGHLLRVPADAVEEYISRQRVGAA